MNLLEVTYNDDGTRRYWRDGVEVSEQEWMLQHPHMKWEGSSSGGQRDSDGGRFGQRERSVGTVKAKGKGDDDAPVKRAKTQREGRPGDGVGRARKRSQSS
jgi:hypothetical protein